MDAPRIAIVHYHLRPGGVASVIRRAAGCLASLGFPGVILSGEPTDDSALPAPVRVVDGLGYADVPTVKPERLVERMADAATAALGGRPDIWHIHNHALGKNPAVTAAVGLLAARGERLLLQIHDFAEDGRAANFLALKRFFAEATMDSLGRRMYPQGPGIHYAVLNRRDRNFLAGAGWAKERLHLLPNAMEPVESVAASSDTGVYLYPTRGIRRKNLGEFLLWSALAADQERFAVTLSPLNPLERPGYAAWKTLARELDLPVDFEVGERPGASLARLMGEAAAIVTTSVAEGFGLAFLEPSLVGKPVLGRNLPEITEDFVKRGVEFPGLYERLEVPAAWLDLPVLWNKIERGMTALYDAFGLERTDRHPAAARAAFLRDGRVDFGRLDEDLQRGVIRRIRGAPGDGSCIRPAHLKAKTLDAGTTARNREIILREFGPQRNADNLQSIYRRLLAGDAAGRPDVSESALIRHFLAPERLYLLRTS